MELWSAGDCQRFVHFDTAYRITGGKALQMVLRLIQLTESQLQVVAELCVAGDCQRFVHFETAYRFTVGEALQKWSLTLAGTNVS